jgi:hypothetical protein
VTHGQRTTTAYRARAEMHRPSDPTAIEAEIRRLNRDGLTARDIGVALRLDHGVVLQALHGALQLNQHNSRNDNDRDDDRI